LACRFLAVCGPAHITKDPHRGRCDLWAIFLFGRVIGHGGTGVLAGTFEFLGMNWMAVLFLTFIPLLAIDLATLFGFLMPRISASLRGWAFLVGVVLSLIAIFQGLRPPVVEKYEVSLPGLPDAMDGTVLVALSDMHLGSQLGARWLAARIAHGAPWGAPWGRP